MIDRRTLIKLLLASAVAEAVDVERLLWTPKPIITVPALPSIVRLEVFDARHNRWIDITSDVRKITIAHSLNSPSMIETTPAMNHKGELRVTIDNYVIAKHPSLLDVQTVRFV